MKCPSLRWGSLEGPGMLQHRQHKAPSQHPTPLLPWISRHIFVDPPAVQQCISRLVLHQFFQRLLPRRRHPITLLLQLACFKMSWPHPGQDQNRERARRHPPSPFCQWHPVLHLVLRRLLPRRTHPMTTSLHLAGFKKSWPHPGRGQSQDYARQCQQHLPSSPFLQRQLVTPLQ